MKKITTLLTMALLVSFSWHGMAQNGGDTCDMAVVATPGTYSDAAVTNTAGGANTAGATDAIWYSYTPTADGTIDVGACMSDPSGVDTRLRIYDGTCAALNMVEDDDDGCAAPNNFASLVTELAVTANTTYYIEWDDRWSTAPFDWTLTFTPPPSCLEVTNIAVAPTATDAVVSWDEEPNATDGYIVNVFADGADPTVDTPVYTEDVAAGTSMTTATGLTQDTPYDLYVIADCGAADGISEATVVNFNTLVSCPNVTDVDANASIDSVSITWTDEVASIDGYTVSIFADGDDPDVDTPVVPEQMVAQGTMMASFSGLTTDTPYDAYVVGDCGATNGTSSGALLSFTTLEDGGSFTCGELFVDAGGVSPTDDPAATGYANNSNIQYSIVPITAAEPVTITFTYVDLETAGSGGVQEGCWDFFTIYNGPDTNSPILANTKCGEESGDGSVPTPVNSLLSVGDEFTSTHPSGALTVVFKSDGSAAQTGWEADVTCSPPPVCAEPENFAVDNITETTADFTWDDVAEATNGYILTVFNEGDDPAVDTAVDTQMIPAGTLMATTSLLLATSSYDAYIQSDCDVVGVSTTDMITFSTLIAPPACGGKFYDTGGPDNDFMNNEDYQVIISPDNVGDVVTASFVFVDNAGGGFDMLTVDLGDGNFILVPDVDMGDPAVDFTSIAADGSLIFNFVSTAVTPNPGWDADITCGPPPTCPEPTNFAVANITDSTADFTWEAVTAAADGYTLSVFTDGADPMVDTPVYTMDLATGILMDTATGLDPLMDYDAYINANCGVGDISTQDLLNFSTLGVPGPNATCDTALVITPGLYTGQIVDATPGNNNGDSLWYSYTPDEDGIATITSCFDGDNDDTRVFVSSGPCDALVPVANDDDGCDAPDGLSSLIQNVALTAGTEYFIQWDDRWSTAEFDWELTYVVDGGDCAPVENIVLSNITDSTVDVTWDEQATAVDGYQLVVFLPGTDDTAYVSPVIPQNTPMGTAEGLLPEMMYEARVTSLCDIDADPLVLAFSDRFPFTTDILGLGDNNVLNVSIFPNPTSGMVTLTTNEDVQTVVVYSMLGQEVLNVTPNANTFEINLSNVATGTYFAKVTSNGATSVHKIIKD